MSRIREERVPHREILRHFLQPRANIVLAQLKKMADGKKKATTKPRKLVRRTTSYKVPKTSASYKD